MKSLQNARRFRLWSLCAAAVLVAVLVPDIACAQFLHTPLKDIARIDQKLDEQVPLDLTFRDETGQPVRLGDYFHKGKPVVLSLVYYECPMLCTLVLNGMEQVFTEIPFTIGKEFEVVTVSINPNETPYLAARKKTTYIEKYGRPGAADGWHFLTGTDDQIHKLAAAVGFHYAFDPRTNQFAHASGIMVLTPTGRVSRYLYGLDYKARDMRLGLVESSQNRIGSRTDQLLLLCYHYDPQNGKYGVVVMNLIRAGGTATVLAMGLLVLVLFRREGRPKSRA